MRSDGHAPPESRPAPPAPPLPRGPRALLRLLLPRAERDELLADVAAEYAARAARDGAPAAGRWVWRQALRSAPELLGWRWRRSWARHEPVANVYRPGGLMLKHLVTDARYAARRLRARPVYALVAILTLALGVGGTAAVFGLARPMLLDELPYANADRVGTLWMAGAWNEQEFTHLRGRFPGFELMAAHRPSDVTLRDGDAPARLVPGIAATSELFDVLGAPPLLGRGFQAGDDVQGAEPVAVISHGLWQELGGDAAVVGRRLVLDGAPTTVVGVMPRGFWYPDPATRVWLAHRIVPDRRNGSYTLVGRTAPGVDVHAMTPHLARLTTMLGERFEYAEAWDKTQNAEVVPLREQLLGEMRPALVATLAAMGLILLIACANVAALMLGQVEGRATELAVRAALGANRRRLAQQLVIEALLVGLGAGALGALLAVLGFPLLARALPIGAWGEAAAFDWTLFAAALLLALGAALAVVLIPSALLWRGERRGLLRAALGGTRTGGIQGRGGRAEQGLVVVQVALAMLVASGAALLARSVTNLYAIDPGVDVTGVAVVEFVGSSQQSGEERRQMTDALIAALAELPGVRTAAATGKLPLTGSGNSFGGAVEGTDDGRPMPSTYFRVVSRDYFETMGIALRRGRTFDATDRQLTDADTGDVELAIVVNEALVDRYFPGEDPIGRRMVGGYDVPQRIVGVVANVAEGNLTDPPEPTRYYLGGQAPWWWASTTLVVRTSRAGDAAGLLDAARRTVQRVAPEVAVQETTTLQRVLDTAVGPARQVLLLLALLASLALVLGAVGIYGVLSHFVARRRRDWAIRLALGLSTRRVVTRIVQQGVGLVALGVGVGTLATLVLARFLTSLLFGVGTVDAPALAAAAAALLGVGLVAALVPARRAGATSPAHVLRES